ncbi:terminase family protein [Acetobacter sacchari]|uniref:Terminase family protein n=1 Tax=Acetobacter sacchari TaxID=2661687 RepID=A0ABS3LZR7_9PROT|nr:terminase family protein [Acetobacter sacchari]MBO1361421.1 terminase family protein [Acetobacter sacchari]
MTSDPFARDLANAIDPVRFATNVLGVQPDRWQAQFLRSADKRVLLNCSRQSGKSTITAALAAHTALYRPRSLVLMIARAQRQSVELLGKSRDFLGRVPGLPSLDKDATLELKLGNKSRIVALPGDNEDAIRGYSAPDLIIADEAAFIDERVFTALFPMIAAAPHARMLLLSTPNGQHGAFYRFWSEGGETWRRFEVPAEQCPRISAEFLEEARRTAGPFKFSQEYQCKFIGDDLQLFDDAAIDRAFNRDVEFLPLRF